MLYESHSGSRSSESEVAEQATRWFVMMCSEFVSEQDKKAHQEWLSANPDHQKEYVALEKIWTVMGDFAERPEVIDQCRKITPTELPVDCESDSHLQYEISQLQLKSKRLQTLSARLQLEAQATTPDLAAKSVYVPFNFTRYALLAMLVVVMAGAGLIFQLSWFKGVWGQLFTQSLHQTAIGEQRTWYLSDGTSVILDTNSELRTKFSSTSRTVYLKKGRVRFNVAHDSERPFIVKAGNGSTTALGTSFVVDFSDNVTSVTLLEGKVVVSQGDWLDSESKAHLPVHNDGKKIVLDPGQQVSYSPDQFSSAVNIDIVKETAWQQGKLIFDDYTLREVLNELNRYSDKKIVLGDSALASLRVTGVFKPGDNKTAIKILKTYFSMQVTTDLQGNLVLQQKYRASLVN